MWPPLPPQTRRAEFREMLDAARAQFPQSLSAPDQSIHYGNAVIALDRFAEQLFRASVANSDGNFPAILRRVQSESPHVISRVDVNRLASLHKARNAAQHEDGKSDAAMAAELMKIAEQLFINAFVVHPSEQASPATIQEFTSVLEKIRAIAGEICERDGIQGAMGYSAEYLYLSRHFPVYEELLGGLHSIRDGVVREDQIVQLLAKARAVLAALPV